MVNETGIAAAIARAAGRDPDPKANGFNYGAALPYAPQEIALFEEYASHLRNVAHTASARAWRLDMAIRDFRHATTAIERNDARVTLHHCYSNLMRETFDRPSEANPPAPHDDPTPNYSFDEIAAIGKPLTNPVGVARTPYQRDAADAFKRDNDNG
jgi:hypothetical protein